jgi:hypothetical protein
MIIDAHSIDIDIFHTYSPWCICCEELQPADIQPLAVLSQGLARLLRIERADAI